MNAFERREQGFETQFAHDEELRFKAKARRDKLLGHWVADLLGETGADAEAYVDSLIAADVAEPGGGAIFRKIRAELDPAGVQVSDRQIECKIEELLIKATAEISGIPEPT